MSSVYAYVEDNPITGTDPFGLEGPGSWTYPAGSPDALDYQRAKAGCYDTQVEGLLLATITIAAMGGPEDPAADAAAAEEIALIDGTDIVFQTGHYAPRLILDGVDITEAETTVAGEVNATTAMPGADIGGWFEGRVFMSGNTLQYRAYPLPNGSINVGTIFVPK